MKCPVCGKMFDVLYPQLWRYRRNGRYICSFSCVRLIDKGETKMEKFTKEQRAEAIRIALEGGNPKEYLRSIGSTSPDNLWYYMKGQLRKNDPETYEKLAKVTGVKKQAEKAPVVSAVDVVAAVNGKPETAGPIKRMKRYTVTAIKYPEIGEFYYDRKYNAIDWRTAEGEEVSMSPTGWKLLLQDLPEIFEALGVEV